MFPNPNINCGVLDIGEGDYIRCYSDYDIDYSLTSNSCEYLPVSITYNSFCEDVIIYSSNDGIMIDLENYSSSDFELNTSIYDINGRLLKNSLLRNKGIHCISLNFTCQFLVIKITDGCNSTSKLIKIK